MTSSTLAMAPGSELAPAGAGRPATGGALEGIRALASLARALGKLLWPTVFLALLFVILANLGRYYSAKPAAAPARLLRSVPMTDAERRVRLDGALAAALREAHTAAGKHARECLQPWIDEMKSRIDPGFLDWYFGYFTQNVLGIRGLLSEVGHWMSSSQPTAAEKLTEDFQMEFAARVLRPELAQLRLERIRDEVVRFYVERVRRNVAAVPQQYDISEVDWNLHIERISQMGARTDASRNVPLSLKALLGSGSAATAVAVKQVASLTMKLGATASTKLAGTAAKELAAKTGGKVAAKFGGEVLGAVVGIGILVWDYLDHCSTAKAHRPVLRANLLEYLDAMMEDIVSNPSTGLLAAIESLEQQLMGRTVGP